MSPRARTDPAVAMGDRAAAFILDWIVLGGAAFLAAGGGWPGVAALVIVTLLDQGLLAGVTGWSLGKAITGVRVCRVASEEAPSAWAGLLRWLLLWVDLLVFGLVGLIVAGRSKRRQRIGDRVAKTWVIGLAPPARFRVTAGLVFVALCVALVFVRSSAAGFAVSGLFGPFAAGCAVIVAGIAQRRAPWPWLVGLGVALVPACWMAFVKLCDRIAGTCISGDELQTSQQAVVSVIAFALATALLPVPRSRVRDAAFQVLVLFGQAWLLLKLIDSDEVPEAIMVIALVVLELGCEVFARVRASRESTALAA